MSATIIGFALIIVSIMSITDEIKKGDNKCYVHESNYKAEDTTVKKQIEYIKEPPNDKQQIVEEVVITKQVNERRKYVV